MRYKRLRALDIYLSRNNIFKQLQDVLEEIEEKDITEKARDYSDKYKS